MLRSNIPQQVVAEYPFHVSLTLLDCICIVLLRVIECDSKHSNTFPVASTKIQSFHHSHSYPLLREKSSVNLDTEPDANPLQMYRHPMHEINTPPRSMIYTSKINKFAPIECNDSSRNFLQPQPRLSE